MSDTATMNVSTYDDVMVDMILGYECNVKCDYCSVSDEMRRHKMSTAEALAELSRARSLGIRKVAFGGGEPTIRPDLLALVRWCVERGFYDVKVSSNGLMFSYPAYAKEIVEAGVNRFHISAKAHTPELYEKIIGVKGGLDLVLKGVDNLIALGRVPILDLIVKNDTWEHIPDMIRFWAARGVETFPLWLVSLSDGNAMNIESLPKVSDIKHKLFEAFEVGRELGVTVYSRDIPRCILKGYEANVRDLTLDRVLIVTPGSRFFFWESAISPNTFTEKCEGCLYRYGECQGLRRDYLARFGDDELDPYLP
ncbi:MAG TPA: radical SAM protein [Myxococcota bacterium]|nr:radical SAM protein [Myxococcota bacterium]